MVSKPFLKTDDLHQFCCQRPTCPDYGKRGISNLTVSGISGGQGNRMLRCKTCGYRFSENRGIALFNSKNEHEKAVTIMKHLSEGCGLRKTSRLTEVSLGTVARLLKKSGPHTQLTHDELVSFPPPDK
jgi:transposase-like protein